MFTIYSARHFASVLMVMFVMAFGVVGVALAQDATLACDRRGCEPRALGALFSDDLRWMPGALVQRVIAITNTDRALPLLVALDLSQATPRSSDCVLGEELLLRVANVRGEIVEHSLVDWGHAAPILLGEIAPGSRAQYLVQVRMRSEAGNACQGKSVQTNIRLRIEPQQQTDRSKGQVLGASDQIFSQSAPSCTTCFWWPLYALQLVLYAIYGLLLRGRRVLAGMLAMGPVAAGIPVAAQLLYLVINSGCLRSWHGIAYVPAANPFCALMLLWSLAMYLVFLVIWGLLVYRPKTK